jgi:hypothetical protein
VTGGGNAERAGDASRALPPRVHVPGFGRRRPSGGSEEDKTMHRNAKLAMVGALLLAAVGCQTPAEKQAGERAEARKEITEAGKDAREKIDDANKDLNKDLNRQTKDINEGVKDHGEEVVDATKKINEEVDEAA